MLAEGFEGAFIGLATRCGAPHPVAAYDYDKCIDVLCDRDGMDREGAVEFFDYNVIGSYVGEFGPVFVHSGELSEEMLN